MSPAGGSTAMPVTLDARERLRDQQRQEAKQLDAVLAAQRRLATERGKADRMIAKAEAGVAMRQADVDAAVVALVEISGISRAAVLVGASDNELNRLVRADRRRVSAPRGRESSPPGVQA